MSRGVGLNFDLTRNLRHASYGWLRRVIWIMDWLGRPGLGPPACGFVISTVNVNRLDAPCEGRYCWGGNRRSSKIEEGKGRPFGRALGEGPKVELACQFWC